MLPLRKWKRQHQFLLFQIRTDTAFSIISLNPFVMIPTFQSQNN